MPMLTQGVYADIANERWRQKDKGYTPDHDDNHSTTDFLAFIEQRIPRVGSARFLDMDDGKNHDRERQVLVQIAALAVAAIERLDRTT